MAGRSGRTQEIPGARACSSGSNSMGRRQSRDPENGPRSCRVEWRDGLLFRWSDGRPFDALRLLRAFGASGMACHEQGPEGRAEWLISAADGFNYSRPATLRHPVADLTPRLRLSFVALSLLATGRLGAEDKPVVAGDTLAI